MQCKTDNLPAKQTEGMASQVLFGQPMACKMMP